MAVQFCSVTFHANGVVISHFVCNKCNTKGCKLSRGRSVIDTLSKLSTPPRLIEAQKLAMDNEKELNIPDAKHRYPHTDPVNSAGNKPGFHCPIVRLLKPRIGWFKIWNRKYFCPVREWPRRSGISESRAANCDVRTLIELSCCVAYLQPTNSHSTMACIPRFVVATILFDSLFANIVEYNYSLDNSIRTLVVCGPQ